MILVTGGAGYIGSHTCVELLNAGEEVVVLDNFSNSSRTSLERVQQICGKPLDGRRRRHSRPGGGRESLDRIRMHGRHPFRRPEIRVRFRHVAARLLRQQRHRHPSPVARHAGERRQAHHLLSSATVYGDPKFLPYTEDHPLSPVNPYGRTKFIVEEMLRDLFASDPSWSIGILRYFNPIGAHESGLIGEDPKGVPNNLLPFVAQVAVGRRDRLNVFGGDYDTPDGTGVRDYIHVVDLAQGHVAALASLDRPACFTVNLGTGRGYSVLEVVKAFEHASGKPVPYDIRPRRSGDIAACYAATDRAAKYLGGWQATRNLEAMCRDHWRWQSQNPNGYDG